MIPPYTQLHFDVEFNAGKLATCAVADPGAQGAGVTGMHGPGVRTPSAAAVNDAVVGFERLMHTPNGMMFIIGLLSMMFAIGLFTAIVRLAGSTEMLEGAAPNEHMSMSPRTTGCGMAAR